MARIRDDQTQQPSGHDEQGESTEDSEEAVRADGGIELFSQEELMNLICHTVSGARGQRPGQRIPEEDLQKIFDWAHEARWNAIFLNMALDGQILLSVKNGKVVLLANDDAEREE